MGRKHLVFILLLLAVLIALPPVLTGMFAERGAHQALDEQLPLAAAERFSQAAKLMPWRTDLWEQAALAAIQGGDDASALAYYSKIISRFGAVSPAEELPYGDLLWRSGQFESALALWEEMRDEGRESADLYIRLAQAYKIMGNEPARIASLEVLLLFAPDNAEANFELGLLLASHAQDPALAYFARSAQLNPAYETAYNKMRSALNITFLEQNRAYQLLVAGRGLADIGYWDLAANAFQRAVQTEPDYAEAWAWLAEARAQTGQDATVELDKAFALNPTSSMVLMLRALNFQRTGKTAEAVDLFKIVLARDVKSPSIYASLASAQAQNGELLAALEGYTKATRLAPTEVIFWKLLAGFCADYNYLPLEEGIPAIGKARELAPQDPQVLILQARLLIILGYPDVAETMLQRSIALQADLPEAYLYLGALYLNRNDLVSAQQAYQKALQLDPDGIIGTQARRVLQRYFP